MKKLLIADDQAGIRSLVRMTLESDAYEILEAADGNQALALAREHHPDIILLDVMMPGMNGLEAAERLRSQSSTQQIPIVFVSASHFAQNAVLIMLD